MIGRQPTTCEMVVTKRALPSEDSGHTVTEHTVEVRITDIQCGLLTMDKADALLARAIHECGTFFSRSVFIDIAPLRIHERFTLHLEEYMNSNGAGTLHPQYEDIMISVSVSSGGNRITVNNV